MSPTLAHSNSPAPLAPNLDATFAPRAIVVARPPGPLHGGHGTQVCCTLTSPELRLHLMSNRKNSVC